MHEATVMHVASNHLMHVTTLWQLMHVAYAIQDFF